MEIDEIFGENGLLAARFPRFERRQGQEEMAAAVAAVLAGPPEEEVSDFLEEEAVKARVLVVEAETGIGKTLAYLIPAVLSGKRVIISTATLNLQDQIRDKDIPLVETILGRPLEALILKGRENYLCLYRWFQYRSNPQRRLIDDPSLAKIDAWLKTTEIGDRAELTWLGDRTPLWSKLSANSSQCLGGDCPEYNECFITRLRKQAGSAQILVVNHHLFFSDLALRKGGHGELLPRYEAVVFDEAHHIENVASLFFGESWSQYQVVDLLGDLEQQGALELPPDHLELLKGDITALRKRTDNFSAIFPVKPGHFPLVSFVKDFGEEEWREEVELLAFGLGRLADRLSGWAPLGEMWNGYANRAEGLRDSLLAVADEAEGETEGAFVRWYDRRERSLLLSATPVDVAPELAKSLYTGVSACVMTSATLSTGGSFSYLQKRLGLGDEVEFLKYASPFDYKERTRLYLPERTFPDPGAKDFRSAVSARVVELLYSSRGRALVLCTSYRGMEELADVLEEQLDYPVLVQGMESKAALLTRFREETHSVLVAVASFWEGVDVAGEALSCVVIDKLPFEVPNDPVIEARSHRVEEEGGNAFFGFLVPRAVLTLRQGVGRLMRTAKDRGVVAILDVRLLTKGYGKTFLRSLPPSPRCSSLEEVDAFFAADNK